MVALCRERQQLQRGALNPTTTQPLHQMLIHGLDHQRGKLDSASSQHHKQRGWPCLEQVREYSHSLLSQWRKPPCRDTQLQHYDLVQGQNIQAVHPPYFFSWVSFLVLFFILFSLMQIHFHCPFLQYVLPVALPAPQHNFCWHINQSPNLLFAVYNASIYSIQLTLLGLT